MIAGAETLRGAFKAYDNFRDDRRPGCLDWRDAAGELAFDSAFHARGLASAPNAGSRVEQRRDSVVDRKGWRSELRDEIIAPRARGDAP